MESPKSELEPTNEGKKVALKSRKNFVPGNGLIIAFVALTIVGCLLVLPRPTYPQILPLPQIDREEIARREQLEIQRALAARDGSLDKETRAVGEQVRRLGMILSEQTKVDSAALRQLQKDAQNLRERPSKDGELSGEESLLRLRALQGQMFLDAAHKWRRENALNVSLQELGGHFHAIASEGWLDDNGKLLPDDDALRLFFRIHFGVLTGLHKHHPFEPSLEELRRYYLTNLLHPPGAATDSATRLQAQIGFVRALGKADSTYPGLLAQGILELRLGQFLLAQQHLRTYNQQHPQGAWAALGRNHLMLATRQANALVDGEF